MASTSTAALSWRPRPPQCLSRPCATSPRSRTVGTTCSLPLLSCKVGAGGISSASGSKSFLMGNSWRFNPLDFGLEHSRSYWERSRVRTRTGGVVATRAGMRLDPGGGNQNGAGRVIINLALAGGLTYLTLTGKLGWVFDTLISLWLLALLIPIVSFVVFLWFAERGTVKGACPNCGQSLQMLEFVMKQQPTNRCPYCSQPFKLDSGRQFVRDEPRFSEDRSGAYRDGFGGFGGFSRGSSSPKSQDSGGVIVDIEAEVRDRD